MAISKFPTAPNVKDAECIETVAMANGAGTVYTDGHDLGTAAPQLARPVELEIIVPALTGTQMPSTTTLVQAVQDSADDSSYTTLFTLPTLTSSSGIATVNRRVGIPSNCRRYLRVATTTADVGGASVGDCRAASVISQIVF